MKEISERRIRVALIPWIAYGHTSAFLELAKRLAKRNFYVYFCSTPANLRSFESKIPNDGIEVVELHLPSSPELPSHFHTTNGLPPHLLKTLTTTVEQSHSTYRQILSTISPDFYIYDYRPSWSVSLANSLRIPSAIFLTVSASVIALFLFPEKCQQDYPFPSNLLQKYNENSEEGWEMSLRHNLVLVRTSRDIEGKYLDLIQNVRRALPVGTIVGEPDDCEDNRNEILQWLDEREPSSTVFVSFGSEFYLSREQIVEIANGLEIAGVSFVWVLRFHQEKTSSPEDALPLGFLSRIGETRGKIVEWAPQGRILRHRSVGGFVSHCGWASVTESLMFGVPIIGMPMSYDQPFNSKLAENLGVGIEVRRGKDGSFTSEEVARAISMVVMEETGERIKKKAAEMSLRLKLNEDMEMEGVVKGIDEFVSVEINSE